MIFEGKCYNNHDQQSTVVNGDTAFFRRKGRKNDDEKTKYNCKYSDKGKTL